MGKNSYHAISTRTLHSIFRIFPKLSSAVCLGSFGTVVSLFNFSGSKEKFHLSGCTSGVVACFHTDFKRGLAGFVRCNKVFVRESLKYQSTCSGFLFRVMVQVV